MMELSAHLVDSVIPSVPVRQWVLTLPYPLRYQLAWNHERTRAILAIFVRALEGFYRARAKALGISDGRGGAVTVVQRVGSALNLNPHFHTNALDGVFSRAQDGGLEFHPLGTLTDEEVAELVATVRYRVLRKLEREGLLDEDEASFQIDALSDESPALAGIYSAGVQGRVALGQRSGRRVMRIGTDPSAPWVTSRTPLQAHLEGFDLHAGVSVRAEDREGLERLCRYILRPPVVQDRLELLEDGRIVLELKRAFWDGTSHLLFEPLELLEKVAATIPRPRSNQLIYHGVLGPNAAWRKEVVSFGRDAPAADAPKPEEAAVDRVDDGEGDTDPPAPRRRSYTWAELLARAFLIDILECPKCSGRMKLIALIEEPRVVRKILNHLGEPTTIPSPAPARSPPWAEDEDAAFIGTGHSRFTVFSKIEAATAQTSLTVVVGEEREAGGLQPWESVVATNTIPGADHDRPLQDRSTDFPEGEPCRLISRHARRLRLGLRSIREFRGLEAHDLRRATDDGGFARAAFRQHQRDGRRPTCGRRR